MATVAREASPRARRSSNAAPVPGPTGPAQAQLVCFAGCLDARVCDGLGIVPGCLLTTLDMAARRVVSLLLQQPAREGGPRVGVVR